MATDSTIRDLDDLVAASASVRRRFEWQAYLNIAFYSGQQWVAWDGSQLWEPPVEEWRDKVVDNRIKPLVRTEIAKMTKTRPQFVGVPKTQSDQDVGAARYAEMALDDAWKRHDLLRKLRAALLWSRLAGAGFWKVWWDGTLGDSRDVLVYSPDHPDESLRGSAVKDRYGAPVDPKEYMPPSGAEGLVTQKSVAMGEVCVELRSFFEVYPDPLCGEEGIQSAEWIAEESVYSRDYCTKHFPDFADQLTYDSVPSAGISESRLPMPGLTTPDVSTKAKGAKLREFWSADKHCVWQQGKAFIVEEANPYPWLPYAMFRGIPVPGRFWPDASVSDLRPRQADLNKRLSDIAANAERIGNPPLLVPSSIAPDFDWIGLPGEELVFQDTGSPTAKPAFMDVPELPGYVQNDVERIERSLQEISGQHEVTGAQVPTGVTAASAINLLQEADDTRLGPDVADMEQGVADAGRRIKWLIRRYYSDQRHLLIAGEDGHWDVEAFKGDMLDGCQDVDVQAGSGMPQSKAAQQAAISQMLNLFVQNQIPLSERSLRKVFSEMQVGGLEQFFASQSRDEQQIQEENRRIFIGEDLPINSYDNDPIHVDGHQDLQKTSRYMAWPDDAKARMERHVQAHRDRLDQHAFAAQQPLPGLGPPAGTAPPPSPTNGASPPAGLASSLPSPQG